MDDIVNVCRQKAQDIRRFGAASFEAHWLDKLADEITRLRAELAKREWQPIETAPKDGTEIIVGTWLRNEWRVCQAAWTYFPGVPTPDTDEPDLWWWNCDADWGGITDYPGPTHWMPLPEPPK